MLLIFHFIVFFSLSPFSVLKLSTIARAYFFYDFHKSFFICSSQFCKQRLVFFKHFTMSLFFLFSFFFFWFISFILCNSFIRSSWMKEVMAYQEKKNVAWLNTHENIIDKRQISRWWDYLMPKRKPKGKYSCRSILVPDCCGRMSILVKVNLRNHPCSPLIEYKSTCALLPEFREAL